MRSNDVFLQSVALCLSIVGCDGNGHAGGARGGTPPDEPTVEVQASSVEVGFFEGLIRDPKSVDGFSISKSPITRRDFKACLGAACSAAPAPRCASLAGGHPLERPDMEDEDLPDDAPATCVGIEQATKYCSWVGGKLPTLEQWLLAARGPSVRRYAWGNEVPDCKHHPRGLTDDRKSCEPTAAHPFQIGQYEDGASSTGLQDVLLTRGELLRASKNKIFSACDGASTSDNAPHCVVYGFAPAAIEAVLRVKQSEPSSGNNDDKDKDETEEISPWPYGFRCVWEDGSK